MKRQTQAAAAARDGFVTYDELGGPDLDAARWSPARLPLPTGGEHIPLDPNAELVVGGGEVRVTIPRFSLSHDRAQSADSPKYLVFSTRRFALPPDRAATFAVDLAVENIGGEPADFRRGMAAFHVFDLDVSQRVFAVCGTSTRVFALHEQLGLGGGGAGETFYHVVESPYEDFDDDFTRLRACEITLDRSRSTVRPSTTRTMGPASSRTCKCRVIVDFETPKPRVASPRRATSAVGRTASVMRQ